jgi:hypothetical protein
MGARAVVTLEKFHVDASGANEALSELTKKLACRISDVHCDSSVTDPLLRTKIHGLKDKVLEPNTFPDLIAGLAKSWPAKRTLRIMAIRDSDGEGFKILASCPVTDESNDYGFEREVQIGDEQVDSTSGGGSGQDMTVGYGGIGDFAKAAARALKSPPFMVLRLQFQVSKGTPHN